NERPTRVGAGNPWFVNARTAWLAASHFGPSMLPERSSRNTTSSGTGTAWCVLSAQRAGVASATPASPGPRTPGGPAPGASNPEPLDPHASPTAPNVATRRKSLTASPVLHGHAALTSATSSSVQPADGATSLEAIPKRIFIAAFLCAVTSTLA